MANLPEFLESLRQSLLGSETSKNVAEGASGVYAHTVESLKGYGAGALDKTAQNFNDALPYIERAGFSVTEIEVGIGISPKIVPHLRMVKAISARERDALLTEVQEKRLVHTILTSLFSATAARKRLKFNSYHFTELEMELSVLPSVTLKFKPNSDVGPDEQNELLIQEPTSLNHPEA